MAIVNAYERDSVTDTIQSTHPTPGLATGAAAANLGSDTSTIATGASGDFATVLGGDKCSAQGDYASAGGLQSEASGDYSTAMGFANTASGEAATCLGQSSVASGANAFASGNQCTASGLNSMAVGSLSNASAEGAVALCGSAASGARSLACGYASIASGDYSLATGAIGVAGAHTSACFGQQTEAHGIHSIAMGEDTRTGDSNPTIDGESAFAGNHFSRVSGRASTSFGCNVYVPAISQRSLAHGFGARPIRHTQYALSGGGFIDPSDLENDNRASEEALEHTFRKWTGHAQTSLMVFRGETAGQEDDEVATSPGRVGLVFGPDKEQTLELEEDKAYQVQVTAIVDGIYAGPSNKMACLKYDCIAKNVAGTITLLKNGTATLYGETGTSALTLDIAAVGTGLLFEVKTGEFVTAKIRVAARVEFTEVIFPETMPEPEEWENEE